MSRTNKNIFKYVYIWKGQSNDDIGVARGGVLWEMRSGSYLVKEKLGGLQYNNSTLL